MSEGMVEFDKDNTCIIKMKKNFDDFLSKSRSETSFGRKRLCLDDSRMGAALEDPNDASMTTSLQELDKSVEAKMHAGELAHAKSMVAQLESKLSHAEMLRKKCSVEHDAELARLKQEVQSLKEAASSANLECRRASEREKSTIEQLSETRVAADKASVAYEERILSLQKEKTLMLVQHGQVEEELRQHFVETKNRLMRELAEKELVKSELTELSEQHAVQAKRLKELQAKHRELELTMQEKLSAAERHVRELSEQLAVFAEDRGRVAAACSDLQLLRKYQIENDRLKGENAQLRDVQENVHLLKEKLESASQKVQRYEARLQAMAELEADAETLRSRLRALENGEDVDSTLMLQKSPLVSRRIAEFQCKEAVHLALQGDLRESLHFHKNRANHLETELHKVNALHAGCSNRAQQQDELIKRLQRKLGTVSQERNAYKRTLDSIDGGVTADTAAIGNSKHAAAEQAAASYRAMNQTLEEELNKKCDELLMIQRRCMELERKLEECAENRSSSRVNATDRKDAEAEADRQTIAQLRTEIEALHKNAEKLSSDKNVLEMRLERHNLQGDYDPTTTKIIQLKINPLTELQRQRGSERERLRAENERLKERLKLMDDALAVGERPQDLTAIVEQHLQDSTSISAEEFRTQLVAAENRYKRLSETYKQTTKDYREGVYVLTGYKIDMSLKNQFTVMSQYSEGPEDYLMFKYENGVVELLDTDYARSLGDLAEMHLKQGGTPMFLSALTTELYSRQTVCIDNSSRQ